ncbi:MAG: CBS domain-containing protein [Methylococcaceae bacterium]|nr:CBS domain-containing protein [Methylococcaceae bacterium]
MRVEDLMTQKVFTVEPHDMIDRVFFLLHYEKVRHLPVIEKGKVVGIVSDRDLYKALGPKSNSGSITAEGATELHVLPKKVTHIMHRGVITVSIDTYASKAAALMAENKIGALPVVDAKNKLVGILSATDILKVFAKLEHANEKRVEKIAANAHK